MFAAVGFTTAASGIHRLERHQRVAVQAHTDAETSSLSGKVNDGVNTNAKCNERGAAYIQIALRHLKDIYLRLATSWCCFILQ